MCDLDWESCKKPGIDPHDDGGKKKSDAGAGA